MKTIILISTLLFPALLHASYFDGETHFRREPFKEVFMEIVGEPRVSDEIRADVNVYYFDVMIENLSKENLVYDGTLDGSPGWLLRKWISSRKHSGSKNFYNSKKRLLEDVKCSPSSQVKREYLL